MLNQKEKEQLIRMFNSQKNYVGWSNEELLEERRKLTEKNEKVGMVRSVMSGFDIRDAYEKRGMEIFAIETELARRGNELSTQLRKFRQELERIKSKPDLNLMEGWIERFRTLLLHSYSDRSALIHRFNELTSIEISQINYDFLIYFIDGLLDAPTNNNNAQESSAVVYNHIGDNIMGDKFKQTSSSGNILARNANIGRDVITESTITKTQHSDSKVRDELEKIKDDISSLLYETLGQILRITRETEVSIHSLREEQRSQALILQKIKETYDESWAQLKAQDLKPKELKIIQSFLEVLKSHYSLVAPAIEHLQTSVTNAFM